MKAIEKIKLLKEHAELVQSIPAMKAVQRIKSLKRLSEIIVALGGVVETAPSEPEYQKMEQVGGATNPDLRTNSPTHSSPDVGASDEQSTTEASGNFKGNLSHDFYELLIDSDGVGHSDSDILTSEDLGDYDLTPLEKQLLEHKTIAFGRAMIVIDEVVQSRPMWSVEFGDFNNTLMAVSLFDSIASVDDYSVVAKVGVNLNNPKYKQYVLRLAVNDDGNIIAYPNETGDTALRHTIHYSEKDNVRALINTAIHSIDNERKQKVLLAQKQAKEDEINKINVLKKEVEQAFSGLSDVEIGRAKNQLLKTLTTREFGEQTYKAFIENLIDNHGYKPSQEELMKRKGENAGDTKTVYRIVDDKGSGYEINKTQYVYAKWYYEQKAPMQGNEMSEPTSQAVADILVNEYGWQYNSKKSIMLGRYSNDKFGEFTVSADVKDDDIVANQPLTNVFIGGVRDVVQDAKDFHRRALDWLDSYKSKSVSNENKPNDEQDMNNPNYTQSDIDYLQSIINGTIDLETVDMDKMIEIGEKDEHDPMYEQALQIVSDYLDEMSK